MRALSDVVARRKSKATHSPAGEGSALRLSLRVDGHVCELCPVTAVVCDRTGYVYHPEHYREAAGHIPLDQDDADAVARAADALEGHDPKLRARLLRTLQPPAKPAAKKGAKK